MGVTKANMVRITCIKSSGRSISHTTSLPYRVDPPVTSTEWVDKGCDWCQGSTNLFVFSLKKTPKKKEFQKLFPLFPVPTSPAKEAPWLNEGYVWWIFLFSYF